MKKNQCKEALEIYKTFLNRMTKLSEFLKVAEVMSVCPAGVPQREKQADAPPKRGGKYESGVHLNVFFTQKKKGFHQQGKQHKQLRCAPDRCVPCDLIYSQCFLALN